ncbi:hypothetical protein MES5069_550047 [Mesorhizobium escarrei]|uniref:Type II toxin-antitoxin system RelE/ParE family toxin n=1 Tax=Mesorhizobium escarrei TaxID=666018 RepID=A0ABM9ECA9_9HYPH|nr:hypothetical protein MES5069_550047 [Mesorhizobium escarrei]
MRIVWTRHYLIELASIGDYIGQHNPRAAARLVNDIHSKTARLLSAKSVYRTCRRDQRHS